MFVQVFLKTWFCTVWSKLIERFAQTVLDHINAWEKVNFAYLSTINTVDSRYLDLSYLEVKIWSLPKHENLTTGKKIMWNRGEIGAISPLFHNIFNISLTSRVQLHIYLLNVVNLISFSSILQIWYGAVWISGSISESPLEFEITRVDCNRKVKVLCHLIKLTLSV